MRLRPQERAEIAPSYLCSERHFDRLATENFQGTPSRAIGQALLQVTQYGNVMPSALLSLSGGRMKHRECEWPL